MISPGFGNSRHGRTMRKPSVPNNWCLDQVNPALSKEVDGIDFIHFVYGPDEKETAQTFVEVMKNNYSITCQCLMHDQRLDVQTIKSSKGSKSPSELSLMGPS